MGYLRHRRRHFRDGGAGSWTANEGDLDPITGNLVAYWPLEESSGNRLDLVSSIIANPVSDQGRVAGKYNYGLYCNATGRLVVTNTVLDIATLVTSSFSAFAWAKTSATSQQLIFECAGTAFGGSGNGGAALWQRNDSGYVMNARLWDSSAASIADIKSAAAYNDGNYHLFGMVYDSSAPLLKVWTDNVNASVVPSAAVGNNYNDAGIGGENSSGGSKWGDAIDEFSLWDIALNDTQVAALYNSGTGAFYLG